MPASIVGNSDDTAVILFALANRAGKVLARKPWQTLQREYTFSLVASQASYAFPADYGYFLDFTMWDRTNYWTMRGSLSAQEWQAYKSGVNSSTPQQRFRLKADAIYIDPTPSTTDSVVIEYISSGWVVNTLGARTARFIADDDSSLINEDAMQMDILWRFLNRKGFSYAEEKDQAERFIANIFGNDTPKQPLNMGDENYPWPPLPQVPITGFS